MKVNDKVIWDNKRAVVVMVLDKISIRLDDGVVPHRQQE